MQGYFSSICGLSLLEGFANRGFILVEDGRRAFKSVTCYMLFFIASNCCISSDGKFTKLVKYCGFKMVVLPCAQKQPNRKMTPVVSKYCINTELKGKMYKCT